MVQLRMDRRLQWWTRRDWRWTQARCYTARSGASLLTAATFGNWVARSVPDFKFEANRHQKVRIIRQPQRITVFVDGKEILSERVRNIETRAIRFFARDEEGTEMYLDNIKVRGPQEADSPKNTKAELDYVN